MDATNLNFDYNDILSITVKIAAQTTFESRYANNNKCFFGLSDDPDAKELTVPKGYLCDYAEQTVHPANLTRTTLP